MNVELNNKDKRVNLSKLFLIVLSLSLVLFLSIILAVSFGAADLSPIDSYKIIIYKIFGI